MRIKRTRTQIGILAAILLFGMSEESFSAKRVANRVVSVKQQWNSASPARSYGRTYRFDRDDPYAPGVNWPGKW